jgi:hypothetical protein
VKTAKARWRIIGILFAILLFLFSSEFMLTTFDPLGINRYDADLRAYFNLVERGDHTLFVLPDGVHRFSNWTATIEDGTRVTATQPRDCRIAFMGDSVTFGLGVNDAAVWVNLLAKHYPDTEIRNYAYPGYDASNLRAAFKHVQAHGYVYLVIENDAGAGITQVRRRPSFKLWSLSRYFLVLALGWQQAQQQVVVTDEFMSYLENLPENTLILGIAGGTLATYAAEHHGAILIDRYTSDISANDPHPDAIGHMQLYAAVQPHVDMFISRVCP